MIRETARTDKRAVAERKLKRRVAEMHTGEFLGPKADRVRYEDLAAALLEHYQINGKKSVVYPKNGTPYIPAEPHLGRSFSGYRALEITPERIDEFIKFRLKGDAANATVNRSLAVLRQMFNLAIKQRKLRRADLPLIEMLQERNVRKGFLEPDAYERLLAALPTHLKPVLSMGYYTGMRLGEIRGLRWENVDFATGFIRLDPGTTKNDQARAIPITPSLGEILEFQLKKRDVLHPGCQHVFFKRNGNPIGDFRKAWATACRAAGVPDLIFHDLRRSGVRNLIRAGVAEKTAMAITGHRTRAIFDRYNIVNEDDLKDAAKKLESYHSRGVEAQKASTPRNSTQEENR